MNESRAAARALILEIRRAGFTQMRKTSDGYLYGSGTYRFIVPYAVVQGSATCSYIAELSDRFKLERARRDAEFGTPRRASRETELQPVLNPDDLLTEDAGGSPAADTEAMNLAGAGSTPAPPATITEGAVVEPAAFTGALEGSTPSALPTSHTEEAPMSRENGKRKRKPYSGWTCPKCGETYKTPGRHAQSCTGKGSAASAAREVSARARRARGAPAPEATAASMLNGYAGRVAAFETATADMLALLKEVLTEAEVYKRDSVQLAAMKQQLSVMFDRPAVPR